MCCVVIAFVDFEEQPMPHHMDGGNHDDYPDSDPMNHANSSSRELLNATGSQKSPAASNTREKYARYDYIYLSKYISFCLSLTLLF